jgi:hypothetical protein
VSSRLFLLRKWFVDDSLILAAWAFSTAVCVIYSIAARSPHILTAPDEATAVSMGTDASELLEPYMMRTYLGLIFYQLCLCLTKLSILAFYLRMFSSRPRERFLAWGTVAFVILYGFPLLFMSIFQCHPQEGQFFSQPMACFGFAPLLISSASLHTATDAWLILMIVPCISKLDIPPRQKIALAIVLSLSIFVIAASLVRLQLSLHRHFRPGTVGVTNTLAFFVMTILECDIALICASAPTLRPLLAKLWPRMMNESQRRRSAEIEPGSVDLTVVSYHGYPWTGGNTPMTQSRNGSVGNQLNKTTAGARMPAPPVPALSISHRTPTTLSLRSMMSCMAAPRSRGRGITGDGRPMIDREEPGKVDSRRSSVGFEGYHDQYLGYGGENTPRRESLIVAENNSLGDRRWGESQESFVLGLNDPLSPSRLSPVSGFSGDTYAVMADGISIKENNSIVGETNAEEHQASKEGEDTKDQTRD